MWSELGRRPVHLVVLVLCALGVVLHQAVEWDWYIDDAAIVFAYARNVAAGEGVVPWPGAERIEGVSDPTWTALLVLFELVGLDGFTVAKPLAMLFAAACVPLVYRTAQLAMPDHDGPAPLFAPIALALSAQLSIWSASGLENGLWCFLLAAAVLSTVLDAREGRFARSASCYLLLAWTRPEGVLYAAVGGLWFLVATRRAGHSPWKPVAGWLALFWVPSVALEAARIGYFAWPFPNTYYAKVGDRDTIPFAWNARGWLQAREYAQRLWHGWYLPVHVVGLVGLGGRRSRIALVAVAAVALTLLWPAPDMLRALRFWPDLPDAPRQWLFVRTVLLVALAVLLPLAAIGRAGWEARVLCWSSCVACVLFSIYAGGDWMHAFRWMSLMVPCASVLVAVGIATIADRIELAVSGSRAWGTAGWLVAAFGVCAAAPPNLSQSRDHTLFNRDETPEIVKRRLDYTRSVLRRTMHEGVVQNLEMDQGAHLWWAPDYVEVDMAGLVDIPIARHTYEQRAFVEDYVFRERRPTFGHVHGWWGDVNTKFPTYEGWADMVELPGYPDFPELPPHPGVWARRDLFVAPRWEGTAQRVVFGGDAILEGFDAPTGAWPRGGDGYLELGFATAVPRERDLRLVVFLADGVDRLVSWDLPLGYGLFPMEHWKPGEDVFVGRYPVPVPADLPVGPYDLGFVVLDADGGVLPADRPAESPRFAEGEARFPHAVVVVPPVEVEVHADALVDDAVDDATALRCEEAERRWVLAKRHYPRDESWARGRVTGLRRMLADCWARRAEAEPDAAPRHLAEAHRWDHHSVELARVGAPVGERLWAEGLAARAAGDAETAYATFTALLGFEPWRSWARRYAEEARDARLGLVRGEEPRSDRTERPEDER